MKQKRELLEYLADIEQLAYARSSELTDGPGRGNRIIDVNNGSGLAFTVTPDRGMDLVECSFRGIPLVFRTPNGHRSRAEYEPRGMDWLRNWPGGLLTTCGLRSAGLPNGEFGLHGRASNAAAEDVGVVREWSNGRYRLTVRGVLRESAMFGEHLRQVRTITTELGSNRIELEDEITNLASTPDYLQVLYHCNFGYPLVSPAMRLEASDHPVVPRDREAAGGLPDWAAMPRPTPGAREQCFFHDLPAGEDGFAAIALVNPEQKLRITVAYDTATLPRLVQWKLFDQGHYAVGLEPTNTRLQGRTQEIEDGTAQRIAPGESRRFRMRFSFEEN